MAPVLVVLLLVGLAWWQAPRVLSAAGTFLDNGGAPQKADALVVLAGGWKGERILKAGELVRAGYAPYVLLSGPSSYYEQPECVYAIPFAVKHGYGAEMFQCVPNTAKSTEEEAGVILAEIARRGLKKVVIVSVRTHMRRARILFGRLKPAGLELEYVSVEDRQYRLERWWESREGRKAVLMEWMKLATTPLGL